MTTQAEVLTQNSSKTFLIATLQVLGFAALTGIAAHIKIPLGFTPVPITLQSLVVVLSGAMLGSKKGALSQAAMIALGIVGFSVFSQPLSAAAVLTGPTGGYILGFILTAFVAGAIREKINSRSFIKNFALYFIASLFIFVPGVIWLKVLTGQSWNVSLALGFWPFLLGDALKTAMVAGTLSLKK